MKKLALSLLATAIMTSFSAYAEGGKKGKLKKVAKTECCKKSKCDKTQKCDPKTCTPKPGCGM